MQLGLLPGGGYMRELIPKGPTRLTRYQGEGARRVRLGLILRGQVRTNSGLTRAMKKQNLCVYTHTYYTYIDAYIYIYIYLHIYIYI